MLADPAARIVGAAAIIGAIALIAFVVWMSRK
jgi:hypothetical protein